VYQQAASLMTWAAMNLGTAQLGRGLMDRIATSEGVEEVRRLLGDQLFQVLEVSAFSTSARSVVTALDLCAAALYRMSGLPARKGGKEADVSYWTAQRITASQLEPEQKTWLTSLQTSCEWQFLEPVRHGVTHRYFRTSVYLSTGGVGPIINDVWIDGTTYSMDGLVRRFFLFGEDQFRSFCDGLRSAYPP
jgi:hypothetical protein